MSAEANPTFPEKVHPIRNIARKGVAMLVRNKYGVGLAVVGILAVLLPEFIHQFRYLLIASTALIATGICISLAWIISISKRAH